MKRNILLWLCLGFSLGLFSQSEFTSSEYMEFLDANKSLDAEGLLQQYPAQTTYYSSRKYPAELENYPWFDSIHNRYHFTSGELDLLSQNHFMVTDRLQYYTWIDALTQVYSADLPLFLSTDFILHTLHQSYDEILKSLEIKVLEPNLSDLLDGLYNYFPTVFDKYEANPGMLKSLADVDLYLAVAKSLLDDNKILPQRTSSDLYDKLMTAIGEEKMVEMSLFSGDSIKRKIDFSQFKPRGHYTDIIWTVDGEVTLEKYFKAMMWLGRIDFLLTAPPENPWEPGWGEKDLLRMNLSALVLNEVLRDCGEKELLDKHEQIISFMVGPDDNMTPDELFDLSSNTIDSITDLLDEDVFLSYRESLNSSDDYGQKIMSNFFLVDPYESDPGELPVSFKLLGQKFLIDSYVFSEVVFDRIVFDGVKIWRPLPDPLDIMSVFGSEDAMALMKEEMTEYKYAYKVSQLKYLVDSYDADFWTQSLYNTWLSGLIKLNPLSSDTGLPYFMKTSAWHHEKLNTQLTSWAQLRHDNILYGKQSYTGGTGCSYPYTYVEPYPDFYAHLAMFAIDASAFFNEVLTEEDPVFSQTITDFYAGYAEIMNKLESISSKELTGTALNDTDLVFLKTMVNDYMASGPSVSGWVNDLMFPTEDKWGFDFTVADVHTQPTEQGGAVVGNVLHVGNGLINLGVFIAPNPVNPLLMMCYTGPVGSFHTEVKNNFYRYDDDEWEKLFFEGKKPLRPEWVYAYMADEEGKTVQLSNVLKGIEYTGIDHVPEIRKDIPYLLTYPNPASDEIHFRFILNNESAVMAEIYDLSGRKIKLLYNGIMDAAEHDLQMDLANHEAGIYFIRLQVKGQTYVKRFIVQ